MRNSIFECYPWSQRTRTITTHGHGTTFCLLFSVKWFLHRYTCLNRMLVKIVMIECKYSDKMIQIMWICIFLVLWNHGLFVICMKKNNSSAHVLGGISRVASFHTTDGHLAHKHWTPAVSTIWSDITISLHC